VISISPEAPPPPPPPFPPVDVIDVAVELMIVIVPEFEPG
jgi:hypothetical protein